MLAATSAQAAQSIATVGSGTNAVIVREGRVIVATPTMPLYPGDRLMTRAGGSGTVTMPGNCSVGIGASAMLPVTPTTCSAPQKISFDEGRAGYVGRSSAFADHNDFIPVGIAFGVGLIAALIIIFSGDDHHHHHNVPTSP